MKEDNEDKELVISFFRSKNIEARRFPKKQTDKNPDLELLINGKRFGYCELKSIIERIVLGEHSDPTFNKIQNKIHESTKQFISVNPDHRVPNILFFMNHHSHVEYQDLWYVLSGQITPPTQPSEPIDLRYLERRMRKDDLEKTDFIIWADKEGANVSFVINSESKFYNNLTKTISSKAYEKIGICSDI